MNDMKKSSRTTGLKFVSIIMAAMLLLAALALGATASNLGNSLPSGQRKPSISGVNFTNWSSIYHP